VIWRPVLKKLGSLKEVQLEWDVDDLFDAHELLDLKEAMEAEAMQKAHSGSGKGR